MSCFFIFLVKARSTAQPLDRPAAAGSVPVAAIGWAWSGGELENRGRMLASGSDDKTVKLWDMRKKPQGALLLPHTTQHRGSVKAVVFTPIGNLITASEDMVRLWDMRTPRIPSDIVIELLRIDKLDKPVIGLAVTSNGEGLTMACSDNSLLLWNLKHNEKTTSFTDHVPVRDFAMSLHGSRLATVGKTCLKVWETKSVECNVYSFRGSTRLKSVAMTQDGKVVAVGDEDGVIRVQDTATGVPMCKFHAHNGTINELEFSHDGTQLASASSDNTIKLWETNGNQAISSLTKLPKHVQRDLLIGLTNGPSTNYGPNGGLTNRQKRVLRWSIDFDTVNGNDYLRQLDALGVILAVPGPKNGTYKVVYNLKERPAVLEEVDLRKIARVFRIDDRANSVEQLTAAMGLPKASHVIAFFPETIENDCLKREMDFRDRAEDQILETRFRVSRKSGTYVPVVVEQRSR